MDEISQFLNYLFKDKRGKRYLLFGSAGIIVLLILFLLNYLFLAKHVEPNFFHAYASAKLFFFEGLDIYSDNFNSQLVSFAAEKNVGLIPRETSFGFPTFTLYIYFLFSLISNYFVAQAVWMTFNQILLLLIFSILLKLFDWKMDSYMLWIQAFIAIFFFSNWFNILDQNLSLIQSGFLISSMYFEKKEKPILSGVFLGLCLINPFYFLIPTIFYISILIKKQNAAALFWMLITIILLILSSLIFKPNWIIDYIKTLITSPSIFPFRSSLDNLAILLNFPKNNFWNIFPWIIIIWMLMEWIRTPCCQFNQQHWLISLAFILGQFITIQPDPINSVLLFPVYFFIIFMWNVRTAKKAKYFIYIIGIILSVGLQIINYFISRNLFSLEHFQILNIIGSLFLLINLYWIRGWVNSPYSMDFGGKH